MNDWSTIDLNHLQTMTQMSALQSGAGIRHHNAHTDTDGFDPYEVMMQRKKRQEQPQAFQEPVVQQHHIQDIGALEKFCQQHGIFGFNCGNMSPGAALQFLKSKMGIREEPKVKNLNKNVLFG